MFNTNVTNIYKLYIRKQRLFDHREPNSEFLRLPTEEYNQALFILLLLSISPQFLVCKLCKMEMSQSF